MLPGTPTPLATSPPPLSLLRHKPFLCWVGAVLATWSVLAWCWLTPAFAAEFVHYPLTMVVGAFVAGSTPQGGGAVAFPVLSVFFEVDRVLARDFSLMVQSIGMTSASVFLLGQREARRRCRAFVWWLPTAALGFLFGMLTLQHLRGDLIQALFLGLLAAFAIAYWRSDHRGVEHEVRAHGPRDHAIVALTLFVGGIATSLFGTGADILLFTTLTTWFAVRERAATEVSIVLMAALSIAGFCWRGLVEQALSEAQIRTWLLAVPVVLVMAPLGTWVLTRISAEWILRAVVALDLSQLLWFNLQTPSWHRAGWSAGVGAIAFFACSWLMLRLARRRRREVLAA